MNIKTYTGQDMSKAVTLMWVWCVCERACTSWIWDIRAKGPAYWETERRSGDRPNHELLTVTWLKRKWDRQLFCQIVILKGLKAMRRRKY